MTKFDETTLRELSWDNLKAVARENGLRVTQKREKITEELLQIPRPKMTQLAKLRGDKGAMKVEKIRRRTVGHVKTPPRPASSRGATGVRRTRASTARRASEPQPALEREPAPEPATQPQPEPVEAPAPAPVATAAEGRVEAEPEEELRLLERARALCRVEKEKRAKEEAARAAETQPVHLRAATNEEEDTLVKSASGKPDEEDDTHYREQMVFPRKRVLYPVGVPMPPESPPKPRARTPGPRREDWPDEWRVGLLSPDPSNPRPVFSPPVKKPCEEPAKEKEEAAQSRDEPAKEKESAQSPAPASKEKEVERAPVAGEQEQVDDGDKTDTELAEEDEVFEMTSMDNIRVALPEDEAQHEVDGADKIVREKKRKAEDDEEEEEKTVTALERSPLKRRRTGLRGWLSKVF